ncbi:zinc finger MYM-type protein 1-like [Acyrthosiphon pisum]|uniref:TTF-type domain-containing protein n=1 Tax=Acyrthosiphon pisum TaxID=7029 RepID=A0A8R2BB08_ACYPI|nr:zinc finger MYM-type protein 1-like [Acyrthosiphon pisum]|eukprot:XP_008189315.1 PREDICTED: zinc finger MYM-type protein 1-like [Acyrthosiphon pisum]
MFSIFNFNKSKTSEDDTQKNIPLNTTSSSQQVNELNYDLKHSDTQANIVKDLRDLSTGPAQPILPAYPMTVFGKQKRSFNAKYFNEFKWIEYSVEKNAVFCFCCRIFGCSSTDHVFTKSGFTNWERLGTKFSKHSKLNAHAATQTHLMNLAKMDGHNSSKITGNVLCQVSNAHKEFVLKNRSYLKTLIGILLYLGRQGIAFRGNIENEDSLNRGNYLEACKLICEHNPEFKQVFNGEINYTSPFASK